MIRIWTSLLIFMSMATIAVEYDRTEWKHWIDADKDCEDTREEALKRDAYFVFYTNDKCTPKYGIWLDPYTNNYFFDSSSLDADHIVPLKHAHKAGGYLWPPAMKKEFANDPENILMVSASENRSKGARAPHEWMPLNKAYHCEYLRKWVYVRSKYALTSSSEEDDFISVTNSRLKCGMNVPFSFK